MRQRPLIFSTIDIFDVIGERQNNQLGNVHVKDYASNQSHLGKSINGDGEIFLFGNITMNEKDKQEYLSERFPEYFNNIMYPDMWRKY